MMILNVSVHMSLLVYVTNNGKISQSHWFCHEQYWNCFINVFKVTKLKENKQDL